MYYGSSENEYCAIVKTGPKTRASRSCIITMSHDPLRPHAKSILKPLVGAMSRIDATPDVLSVISLVFAICAGITAEYLAGLTVL